MRRSSSPSWAKEVETATSTPEEVGDRLPRPPTNSEEGVRQWAHTSATLQSSTHVNILLLFQFVRHTYQHSASHTALQH